MKIMKILFAFSLIFIFSSCATYPFQKRKARDMAKAYLSEKYEQEMKYLFTYAPLPLFALDRGKYYEVYFSPINNENIRFNVDIKGDLSTVLDDYYLVTRFEVYSETYFQEKMANIWVDNNMRIWFWINNENYFYRHYPMGIDEKTDTEELKHYVGIYSIVIIMEYTLDDKIIEEEALKILEAIKVIKEKNYEPDRIEIWYHDGKEISYARHQHITFYKTSNKTLPLWVEINTEQEIIEILSKYIK
jgi:hypothetical protein